MGGEIDSILQTMKQLNIYKCFKYVFMHFCSHFYADLLVKEFSKNFLTVNIEGKK